MSKTNMIITLMYVIFIIISSMVIFNAYLSVTVISLVVFLIIEFLMLFLLLSAWYITINSGMYLIDYIKNNKHNKNDVNFIIENDLDRYPSIERVAVILRRKFNTLNFLSDISTKEYILYLKNKHKKSNGDKWLIEQYEESINKIKEII
jgi:hypothetical protein